MSSNSEIALVWFRRDLRLDDCEIVAEATKNKQEVIPFFVIDSWFYKQPEISAARVKFLFESLSYMDNSLRQKGSRLFLFEGKSVDVIKSLTRSLLQQTRQPKLYFNRDVQVEYGIERDRNLLDFYKQHNLKVHLGINYFLQIEGENYDNWWRDYHNYHQQPLHLTPEQINTPNLELNLPQLTLTELRQKYRHLLTKGNSRFIGGEDKAHNTLNSFLEQRYFGYHWKMSRPWMAQQGATSHLSSYLDFGNISSRVIYQNTVALSNKLDPKSKGYFSLKTFLDRLRWHDKFSQRHYFHPELAWKNRYREFDEYYFDKPLTGEKLAFFTAWCEGKTGYPMVDASMRQLNQMGWMNFRMRAMCVTFLAISCAVSWHHGARYFMSRLVDGNIAINHWQWQAQAGITNPLSKTFRIYNPTKNLEDKDPYLQFVYHWIPELKECSKSQILAGEYQQNYPQPILDWKQTRKTNGKIVSNLRKKVRQRLEQEEGEEYRQAMGAKKTIEKYVAIKDKQYKDSSS